MKHTRPPSTKKGDVPAKAKGKAGEWMTVPLGEVARVVMGLSPKGETYNQEGHGVPLLNGPTEFGPHYPHATLYTTDPSRFAESGDLLFCVRGSTTGRMNWADRQYAIGRGIAAIRAKTNSKDTFFVYCCICESMKRLLSFTSGSVFPNLSTGDINAFEIPWPEENIRARIVHILGALDDKIELNRRINRTLEKMAAAIFKSWFIDFDPVHAKAEGRDTGLPPEIANLFPSAFEDSELGPIPKGWKVKPLPDAIDINPKRTLAKGTLAPFLEMSNMPTRGPSPDAWRLREMGSGMKFVNGDTLVARITPCLENGKTAFVDFLAGGEVGWGSTEYIVLRPLGEIPPIFAYLLARTTEFRNFAIQQMSGSSGRQRVAADSLTKYQIVGPEVDSPVFRAFGQVVTPFFQRISSTSRQSRNLSKMRDTLLPKLMSGDIDVRNVATVTQEEK